MVENVFGKSSHRENLKKLDFWQILGNHDFYWNATAQVIYAEEMETNFKMPWFWYTWTVDKGDDLILGFIIFSTKFPFV